MLTCAWVYESLLIGIHPPSPPCWLRRVCSESRSSSPSLGLNGMRPQASVCHLDRLELSSPPLFSLLTTPSPLPSCIRRYKASEPSGYLFLVFRGFFICFSLYPGQLWHAYTRYVYSWIKPQISLNDTQYQILLGCFFFLNNHVALLT